MELFLVLGVVPGSMWGCRLSCCRFQLPYVGLCLGLSMGLFLTLGLLPVRGAVPEAVSGTRSCSRYRGPYVRLFPTLGLLPVPGAVPGAIPGACTQLSITQGRADARCRCSVPVSPVPGPHSRLPLCIPVYLSLMTVSS